MRKIIVGFSSGATPFGSVIRLLTGQKISHCYVRLPFDGDPNLSVVFHAAGFNVHYMNYEYFKTFQRSIVSEWEIELTEEQWLQAQKVRYEQAGKPYGWLQIFGYLVVLLKKKWNNPLSDGNRSHVCVEVVAEMLKIPNSESLLPHELESIVANMPRVRKVM